MALDVLVHYQYRRTQLPVANGFFKDVRNQHTQFIVLQDFIILKLLVVACKAIRSKAAGYLLDISLRRFWCRHGVCWTLWRLRYWCKQPDLSKGLLCKEKNFACRVACSVIVVEGLEQSPVFAFRCHLSFCWNKAMNSQTIFFFITSWMVSIMFFLFSF